MIRTTIRGLLSAVALALLLAAPSAAPAAKPAPPPNVTYSILWLDLEAPELFDLTQRKAITRDMNNRGDVVGYSEDAAYVVFGWIYTAETGTFAADDIALPPLDNPGDTTLAIKSCQGINEDRVVSGLCSYQGIDSPFRMVLVVDPETGEPQPTPVEILPPPTGAIGGCTGDRINAEGEVMVYWTDANGGTSKNRISVYTPNGYANTTATKHPDWRANLNNSPVVAGTHLHPSGRRQAFRSVINPNTATETSFQLLPGFVAPSSTETWVSTAHGVNEAGMIAGSALFANKSKSGSPARIHAFLHDGVTMIDVGTLGSNTVARAVDVNSAGQVVGSSGVSREVYPTGDSPFIWTAVNKIHPLDTLVSIDTRWVSASSILVSTINDPLVAGGWGQIAGYAYISDGAGSRYWRPFLLTPVED